MKTKTIGYYHTLRGLSSRTNELGQRVMTVEVIAYLIPSCDRMVLGEYDLTEQSNGEWTQDLCDGVTIRLKKQPSQRLLKGQEIPMLKGDY